MTGEEWLGELAAHLKAARSADGQIYTARCPSHEDRKPSFQFGLTAQARPWIKCHAGCDSSSIKQELKNQGLWPTLRGGLPGQNRDRKDQNATEDEPLAYAPSDLADPDFGGLLPWTPTAVYQYLGTDGLRHGFVARLDLPDGTKDIRPIAPVKRGNDVGWKVSGLLPPRPLFRCDGTAVNGDAPVLLVEGEKTALAAARIFAHLRVRTWCGGASAVGKADFSELNGSHVVCWPDNDDAGRAAMTRAMKLAFAAGAKSCRVVTVPSELPKGWDLGDSIPSDLDLRALLAGAQAPKEHAGLRRFVLSAKQLAELPLPRREYLIEPFLPNRSLSMLYAERGIGKTHLALHLASCVATGEAFLGFKVAKAASILYVDGEMSLSEMQERARSC